MKYSSNKGANGDTSSSFDVVLSQLLDDTFFVTVVARHEQFCSNVVLHEVSRLASVVDQTSLDIKVLRQRILKKCLCSKQEIVFQDTQTDCIQDTAQKMKLKRLKASIATMTRQTDAEQRRPTIKKLEVKQVEFKLGEDCWEIQV
ncbi:hypothetical protein Tco_0287427 [Tanacetum coccineum]